MRKFAVLSLLLLLPLCAPVLAEGRLVSRTTTVTHQGATTVTVVEEVIEEEVDDAAAGSDRFVASSSPSRVPQGVARYGPFRVVDGTRAALVGVTDERSPAAFAAMLAAHPGITVLDLVDCPGTEDDRANLRLGRMIRARGLETHVPAGGSVRSGAVELFLAGTRRSAERGAEFAVHAWADEDGREPRDYPANAPENRAYLDYYRDMGMSGIEARAFYDMTNATPNRSARWMNAAQMEQWVKYN
jgi:hypothetical protein